MTKTKEQQEVEKATALLLIELAFLVPRGTDINQVLGPYLERFKHAVEARTRAYFTGGCTCQLDAHDYNCPVHRLHYE